MTCFLIRIEHHLIQNISFRYEYVAIVTKEDNVYYLPKENTIDHTCHAYKDSHMIMELEV